jgi:hypothetical protein
VATVSARTALATGLTFIRSSYSPISRLAQTCHSCLTTGDLQPPYSGTKIAQNSQRSALQIIFVSEKVPPQFETFREGTGEEYFATETNNQWTWLSSNKPINKTDGSILRSLTLRVDCKRSEDDGRHLGLLSFAFCAYSGVLNYAKEHDVSETGPASVLRLGDWRHLFCWDQCLGLVLSNGRNWVGVSHALTRKCKQIQFPKRRVL